MLLVKDIHKTYGSLPVLRGVGLEVKTGEIVSIVGASGAGKTTLLQIIGTLDKPDLGEVLFGSQNPFLLSDQKISAFRNQHIGFIFQFHQLIPEFTALENVCLPAFIGRHDRKKTETYALELLNLLGVSHRTKHKPAELSGGEQQRVAVARALINRPSIILADEPSGNLDSKNAEDLHDLFFELRKTLQQTFVIVTHNESLANMADRKLVMKDGLIV